jgi:DNA-binding NarL/FixJ family response regulator
VAAGDALLTPSITRRLIAKFARAPAQPAIAEGRAVLGTLTDRERDVLVHVAAGRSNAEISAALQVSIATVKTRVSRLLAKLDGGTAHSLSCRATSSASPSPAGPAADVAARGFSTAFFAVMSRMG